MSSSETVVLVHGLWMPGISMGLLSRRLQACGYRCLTFSYRTLKHDLHTSAEALYSFTQSLHSAPVHFVCHSLGGLVAAQMYAQHAWPDAGRSVALGSPFEGSRAARRMADFTIGRKLLGASCQPLCEGTQPGRGSHFTPGVIAGDLKFGCGQFITRMGNDHDGAVAVAETRIATAADHLTMRVTHTGLLTSARVARQVCYFLKNGHFDQPIGSINR